MGSNRIATAVIAALGAIGTVLAQDGEFRAVANPFQEGYEYRVGDNLAPMVDIEGLRWTLVRVSAADEEPAADSREVSVTVDLEFENRRDRAAEVLVVLLLEDAAGNGLHRITCDVFRAGSGRFKAARHRVKVPGGVLLATRSLYLFCEIQS